MSIKADRFAARRHAGRRRHLARLSLSSGILLKTSCYCRGHPGNCVAVYVLRDKSKARTAHRLGEESDGEDQRDRQGQLSPTRQGSDRISRTRRDHRRRPAPRPPHAGLRRRGLRQDAVRHGVPRARRDASSASPGVFMAFEETAEELAAERRARSASTSTTLIAQKKLLVDHVAHRAERDRGDRRVRPRRAVRPARLRDRLDRRQARRARHDRGAVRRAFATRRSCAPSCAGCSAGSRTRASPPSSPASAATAR